MGNTNISWFLSFCQEERKRLAELERLRKRGGKDTEKSERKSEIGVKEMLRLLDVAYMASKYSSQRMKEFQQILQEEIKEKFGDLPTPEEVKEYEKKIAERLAKTQEKVYNSEHLIFTLKKELARKGQVRPAEAIKILQEKFGVLKEVIEKARELSRQDIPETVSLSIMEKASSFGGNVKAKLAKMKAVFVKIWNWLGATEDILDDMNKVLVDILQSLGANEEGLGEASILSYSRNRKLSYKAKKPKFLKKNAEENIFLTPEGHIAVSDFETSAIYKKIKEDLSWLAGKYPLQTGDIVSVKGDREWKIYSVRSVDPYNNLVRLKGSNNEDVLDVRIDDVKVVKDVGHRRLAKRAIKTYSWDVSKKRPWFRLLQKDGRIILEEVVD